MAYLGDTGQGGTVAFDVSTKIARVRTIQLPTYTIQALEAQALEDTGFVKKIPGDLADAGTSEMAAIFDATIGPPTQGVVETQTVTFPIGDPANTIPATLEGTGFLTDVGLPNMALNTLMELNLTFTYNGDVGPTFTPEAAAVNLSDDDLVSSLTSGKGPAVKIYRRVAIHLADQKPVESCNYVVTLGGVAAGLLSWSGFLNLYDSMSPQSVERIKEAASEFLKKSVTDATAPNVPDSIMNPPEDDIDY